MKKLPKHVVWCTGDNYHLALIQRLIDTVPLAEIMVVFDRTEQWSRLKPTRLLCEAKGVRFININKMRGKWKLTDPNKTSVIVTGWSMRNYDGREAVDLLEHDTLGTVNMLYSKFVGTFKMPDETNHVHVVSFSGGRTSGKLVKLMEHKRKVLGWDVRYTFMDTGAEHPSTYRFIRDVVKHWGIDLVCLRLDVDLTPNSPNSYKIVPLEECKTDLKPWIAMMMKYGSPYLHGAFCTDRMKLVPHNKYCDDTFGKRKYLTYLGMRCDEPERLSPGAGYRYLAEFDDCDKLDVLDWWDEQEFNLMIPEWLGNCVFCIKKGINKIALALIDEPELATQFDAALRADSVREVERNYGKLIMYRGEHSLQSIAELYKNTSREELIANLRGVRKQTADCSNSSCEVRAYDPSMME